MHCNKRTEISIYICVRIIVARKSSMRYVSDRANILSISRALSFTAHPYLIQLQQRGITFQRSGLDTQDFVF
jgi:hypothetical protein